MTQDQVEALLQRAAISAGVPAMAVGITSANGDVFASAGYARLQPQVAADVDTRFEIGSITKVWTATAVLRLVEKGRLSLEAHLVDLLDDFQLAGGAGCDITIRHLLSHTSGIQTDHYGDPGLPTVSTVLPGLRSVPQAHPAGQSWAYLNLGYLLLGAVIERATGLSFAEAMRAEVLLPLADDITEIAPGSSDRAIGYTHDAQSGGFCPEEPGRFPAFAAAGSTVTSTAAAVLRLVYPHLHHGLGPDGRVFLTPESVAEMARMHTRVPPNADRKAGWGLGWGHYELQDGTTVLGHGGGTFGFVSYLIAVPKQRFALVILANSDTGIPAMRSVGDTLLRKMLGSHLYA